MGLLNRIIVEDVLLHDRKNQEMLKVARLSAQFDLLPLLHGKVTISSVQLFGLALIHIEMCIRDRTCTETTGK